MKKLIFSAAAVLCLSAYGFKAHASQFQFQIRATVPVECNYQIQGQQQSGLNLNVSAFRHCNTPHQVSISNRNTDGNAYTVNYQGNSYTLPAGQSISVSSDPVFNHNETVQVTGQNGITPDPSNILVTVNPL